MYADHTPTEMVGQLLIAIFFYAMLIKNIRVWDFNMERTGKIFPYPAAILIVAFIIQFNATTLVLLDFRTDIGAIALIFLTIFATGMFHRFWTMPDPMIRNYHMLLFNNNVAIIGGLFFVI